MNRFIASIVATIGCSAFLLPSQVAGATPATPSIHVSVSNEQCVISPEDQDKLLKFWDGIESFAREQRVAELDKEIAGFAEELRRYDEEQAPIAGELQAKLTAAGVPESLAELSSQNSGFTQNPDFQTTYSYEQTLAAAEAISNDPAASALEKLEANRHSRLDEFRIQKLSQEDQRKQYNALQSALKSSLESCANEIAPPPTWPWYVGGGALIVALIAARAWWNSRKPNRHSRAIG